MDKYFSKLRISGEKIDSDIRKLEKTWETPHLLMSGHGDNIEEAIPYVEGFFGTLKEIQDQLIEDQETQAKEIAKTDEYLSSVDSFYQNMKQHCEEVEMLLIQNGYEPMSKSLECSSLIESETETSILTPEQMENSITSPVSLCDDSDNVLDTFKSLTINNQLRSTTRPRHASISESNVLSST